MRFIKSAAVALLIGISTAANAEVMRVSGTLSFPQVEQQHYAAPDPRFDWATSKSQASGSFQFTYDQSLVSDGGYTTAPVVSVDSFVLNFNDPNVGNVTFDKSNVIVEVNQWSTLTEFQLSNPWDYVGPIFWVAFNAENNVLNGTALFDYADPTTPRVHWFGDGTINGSIAAVPEGDGLIIVLSGLLALLGTRRKKP